MLAGVFSDVVRWFALVQQIELVELNRVPATARAERLDHRLEAEPELRRRVLHAGRDLLEDLPVARPRVLPSRAAPGSPPLADVRHHPLQLGQPPSRDHLGARSAAW